MMDVHRQMLGGTRRKPRPGFSSKEEFQMKWCMVAAMSVSLLFGSMAFAQEDDFDLDALLGDVGTEEPAAAPEGGGG